MIDNLFEISLDEQIVNPEREAGEAGEDKDKDTPPPVKDDADAPENDDKHEEEGEEDISEEEEEGSSVDLSNIKEVYNVFKEYVPLDESEDVSEEWLRTELEEKVPERLFMQVVEGLHTDAQELLEYALNLKEGASKEKLSEFFTKFIQDGKSTYNVKEVDGAREYLKQLPQFKELYDSNEDMEAALDILEDKDKLLGKAKSLKDKEDSIKDQAKAKEKEDAKALKDNRDKTRREFGENIRKELDLTPWSKELKQKTLENLNPNTIATKNEAIRGSAKAITQLAHLYSYFDGESFDALFEILEGKKKSKDVKKTKSNMEKDALGRVIQHTPAKDKKKNGEYVADIIV